MAKLLNLLAVLLCFCILNGCTQTDKPADPSVSPVSGASVSSPSSPSPKVSSPQPSDTVNIKPPNSLTPSPKAENLKINADSNNHIKEGNQYLEQKNYDKAMECFDKAINDYPRSPLGHIGKGRVLAERNKNEEALREFQKALDTDPKNAIVWVNRGNGYARMRKFDRAISDYENAIKLDDSNYMGYFNRGKAILRSTPNLQKRDFERVLVDFDKAASLEDGIDEIFIERGTVYRQIRMYEKAERDLKKALVIRKSAAAHCELAQVYMDMDEPDKALFHLNAAIKIDPEFKKDPYFEDPTNSINGYLSRGQIYSDRKEYRKAMSDFEKALIVKPSDKKPCIEIAYMKEQSGDRTGAVKYAKMWLEQDHRAKSPIRAEDYQNIGNAQLLCGNPDKGIEFLTRAIEMGGNSSAYLERGKAYIQKSDFGKARADFEKVISGDAEDEEKSQAKMYIEKIGKK